MSTEKDQRFSSLKAQGVEVINPATVTIADDVNIARIVGPKTVIFPGTRLSGANLAVGPGCQLGQEAPVTVESCVLGADVQLKGGYFANSVFLDRVTVGSAAHFRPGCLLEEDCVAAHCVGLKQTILLPFVTIGSLINFCDIIMTGGTSRRDHSEVGSSFVHFNFTPYGRSGDKATPSLLGDVARGVMLRSPRIFLGGHGGLVGPVHVDFGTVLAAGFVYRRDHGPNELVIGEDIRLGTRPFTPLRYENVRRRVRKNLEFIGNLVALWFWYEKVRLPAARHDARVLDLYREAQTTVAYCVGERIREMAKLAGYMEDSIAELRGHTIAPSKKVAEEITAQEQFLASWPRLAQELGNFRQLDAQCPCPASLSAAFSGGSAADYLERVQKLDAKAVEAGITWLQSFVNAIVASYRASSTP